MAGLPEGTAVSPGWVREVLTFDLPRRPAPGGAVSAVLAELELLGMTSGGALSGPGRVLAGAVAGHGPDTPPGESRTGPPVEQALEEAS